MYQPIPLFIWFQSAIEYSVIAYLVVIFACLFNKHARKRDIVVYVVAMILVSASLFRLMAWGRNIVSTDRSLHYLTFIVGLIMLLKLYEKAKSQYRPKRF